MPRNLTRQSGGGAPSFIVLYCCIMILLLAFFIVLQTFAPNWQEERFQSGQGSFKRALDTCGLGHLMDRYRRWMEGEATGPRYPASEGNEQPPETRRIDVELAEARGALEELLHYVQVQNEEENPWSAVLVAPFPIQPGQPGEQRGVDETAELFATEIVPLLIERGCVIGIAGLFRCSDAAEIRLSESALRTVESIRRDVLNAVPASLKGRARRSIYSLCRRVTGREGDRDIPRGRTRVDVFVKHFNVKGRDDQS